MEPAGGPGSAALAEMPPPRLLPARGPAMRRATGDSGVQSTNDDAQISKL
jgi:hypothetical protein